MGALAGAGVGARDLGPRRGCWILPLMCVAGFLGGMAWAAIPAFLKTRFNVNEILTSLMLTYVAMQLLSYPGRRPVEGPGGLQLPADRACSPMPRSLPIILEGTRLHLGVAARARRRRRRLVR